MIMEPSDMFLLQKSAGKAGETLGLIAWSDDAKLLSIWSQLSVLLGSDPVLMRHWVHTPNNHLEGKIPANLIVKEDGVDTILSLLLSYNH